LIPEGRLSARFSSSLDLPVPPASCPNVFVPEDISDKTKVADFKNGANIAILFYRESAESRLN